MQITIRRETPKDYRIVEELTREAFWNKYKPGCDEHYLAHIIRDHSDFIPELDLVAEVDGKIVGSIMYTKATLTEKQGEVKDILSFGPLSVLPEYQRMGVGKTLQEESFRLALKMGYDVVVIFGHPGNYIERGYKSCIRYGVGIQGIYPTALMVLELQEGALRKGEWDYAESPVFELDEKKADEFDLLFPVKEKKIERCQEEFFIYSHSRIQMG